MYCLLPHLTSLHSPPSSASGFFFFFFIDRSFWFCCLRFYCLKLEQMVLCLLNTKLCHAGIIISAELAPCKSGFILWNRLKDWEEIHCTAGCQWWAEWMTVHSWTKTQCGWAISILSYRIRFTSGFCILGCNAALQHWEQSWAGELPLGCGVKALPDTELLPCLFFMDQLIWLAWQFCCRNHIIFYLTQFPRSPSA